MTESGPASDRPDTAGGDSKPVGLVVGWLATGVGAAVIIATVAGTLYLMLTADTATQFIGWFFAMLFFGAFPAMMGLGLVIWGGRQVRRSRPRQRSG